MKTQLIVGAMILSCLTTFAQELDFVSIVKKSPSLARSVGLQKLTLKEQVALNTLLNNAYQAGLTKAQGSVGGKAPLRRDVKHPVQQFFVYNTKIEEDKDDILKLSNGAIVEVTAGYLGYLGYRKSAVLYKDGMSWRIWIEGKKTFRCDILKAPTVRTRSTGQKISIFEVKGDGKILTTLGGAIYEVDGMDTIETALWIGSFDALLIDGSELLRLDEGDEAVTVERIK